MKKIILPIIFILTVALFLPSKADAQTKQECNKTRARASYDCLTVRTKCVFSCKGDVSACYKTCDQSNDACEKQVEADYQVCLGTIKKDSENLPKTETSPEVQTSTDCHGVFTKESNACLKESTKCIDSCADKGYAAMSLTVDGGKVMKECTRSVCDPASRACDDKAMANFRTCQDAKNSPKNSAKAEKSPLEKLLDTPVFIGDWLDRISVGSAGLAFLDLSNDLGSVILEDSEIAIWEEEQRQKYNKDFEAAFGKDWQYQMQFSQPKIEAKTEEEAWKTPVSKEQSVIDVSGTSDTKRYSWDENSGVVIKSNDWGKIKFSEPVEVEGFTKHTLELGEGAVEVKVRNNNPAENQFGVDAGWLGVTVSRTHFWVSQSQDKKLAVVGVYEGEVEVKTRDGKTAKVSPDGDKPGVVVLSRKLSITKLAIVGVVLAAVIGGIFLIVRRKFASKGSGKKKR